MNNVNFLPLLPLKDMVLFPGVVSPIFIGREKSLRALQAPQFFSNNGVHLLFVAQKNQHIDDPAAADIYRVGVIAKLLQIVNLPDGTLKIIVEAQNRVQINSIIDTSGFFSAEYNIIEDEAESGDIGMLSSELKNSFSDYVKINKKVSPDVLTAIADQEKLSHLTNLIASHLICSLDKKQKLLENTNIIERSHNLIEMIETDISLINTENSFQSKVKQKIEKNQREYYLNEQMKVIQQELNQGEEKSEIGDLEKKMKATKLSKDAREKAESEIKKLRIMQPMAAEASVVRNHLETLLNMPWGKKTKSNVDISKAEKLLDKEHYGLEKIKERIVDHLAILQRAKTIKGPILCFVGPPGVGKTSLVKSIADAVGRKYCKFALGGVRDEAEIRGHRKTYLGAMPGKIISLIKKSKADNPVILLDEIDKMSSDFRGDPASALLEALDPEQNKAFTDHYLEVEYDLSDVMFIATANSLNLPRPLLDRMELINLSGYIEDEKMQIAVKHLIPKQIKEHNMKESEFSMEDSAILDIIRYYTKESGVRNLERKISTLIRKALRKILSDKEVKSINITSDDLEPYLGVRKYKFGAASETDQIGATTGLAYTEVGGELLTIEAVTIPGKGEIKATGTLGDVMKESTQAAYSYFLSNASKYAITQDLQKSDVHIHVPEGGTPKDGPSAGIAIFTTIVSLMTSRPVKRTVAMTGEITLRGYVLPIGGLKEKLLAAHRGGIKTVIIPQDNVKDLKDIPDSIKSNLEIIPVTLASQVIDIALV